MYICMYVCMYVYIEAFSTPRENILNQKGSEIPMNRE